MISKFFLNSLIILLYLTLVQGYIFELENSGKKCFLEDLPPNTLVKGSYQNYQPFFAIEFAIFDPKNQLMYQKGSITSGKFSFSSETPGLYRFCFTSQNYKKTFGSSTARINFIYSYGKFSVDYDYLSKEDNFNPIEAEFRRMSDLISDISSTMSYMKEREETMRDTNESTNSRVLWFSLLSIFILISVSLWQIVYLNQYLRKKKII
ncbi:transmembrane emp24 domain-containing protein [Anaeramoeba ignava]|uniref:Transmembrane emp24 domain-containing protein n=1 Tax=Anaeramoeba ignava TaxID=1746090 RepID=A0A9Q0LE08_ANAIG|nr:transmembrane emp24 domain-containing protein [Anaeramoeba ignava]|eukprot:Anaeramoba_ignava/c18699_g1_i1.p1 GENE.c18699_g1_i1~~c18699_g1_i1.p1  ORF type:complete len:207 (+),score=54.83 c18699_g1_i1:11-631(+)